MLGNKQFENTPIPCQNDEKDKEDNPQLKNDFEQRSINYEFVCEDNVDLKFVQNIDNIRKEQEEIKNEQELILQKNEELFKQLEFFVITFEKKIESSKEIYKLEKELNQREEFLQNMFEINNFSMHLFKSHDKHKFADANEAINYFYFLQSKTIIYDGWHVFHCLECMNFIVKNQKSIENSIKNYNNLKKQIEDIKSCL